MEGKIKKLIFLCVSEVDSKNKRSGKKWRGREEGEKKGEKGIENEKKKEEEEEKKKNPNIL